MTLQSAALLSLLSIASPLMLPAACVTVHSSCPPQVTYSKEFQARAASELETLPDGSALAIMMTDYGKQRDACRITK